jgi:hypothetical protein
MIFRTDVQVSKPLTQMALAYSNADAAHPDIMPAVPVQSQVGTYKSYSREDTATILPGDFGEKAEANESDRSMTSASYSCVWHALKETVSNDLIANADSPITPLADAVENLMLRANLITEQAVTTLADTSGNYASTAAASAVWSGSSAAPLDDFIAAHNALAPGVSGQTETIAVMVKEALMYLQKTAQLRGGGATDAVVTPEKAASLLGVDRIVVADMEFNSAEKGLTATYARLWNRTVCAVLRVPKGQPGARQSMFGGRFVYQDYQVRQWDEPKVGPKGSKVVQVEWCDDPEIVDTANGYLITGILS